jgi:hypothetical protein
VLIIGKVDRFKCGKQIACYLGLVPVEESSGERRRLGHITKQGSSLLRFLLVEAAQVTVRSIPEWRSQYYHLATRRGRKIAKIGDGSQEWEHMHRIIFLSMALGSAMSSSLWCAPIEVCGPAHGNRAATQARVLILRPRVKIFGDGMSNKVLEGASEGVQSGFYGVLSRTFDERSYTLRFDSTAMAQWEETPPNDGAIKTLQDDYDSLLPSDIYSQPDCKRMLKTSLQVDLKEVAGSNEFDAIVLARAIGEVRSTTGFVTRAAVAVARGLGDASSDKTLYISIGIVDGGTGLPIFYCKSTATGNYMGSPDSRLSAPIQKCLKRYFSRASKSSHQQF